MSLTEYICRQEGVDDKIYFPLTVDIKLPEGGTKQCRVYQQTAKPSEIVDLDNLPSDRRPSAIYLKTMIKGAKESELPEEYQKFLKNIPDNGYNGEVDVNVSLAD